MNDLIEELRCLRDKKIWSDATDAEIEEDARKLSQNLKEKQPQIEDLVKLLPVWGVVGANNDPAGNHSLTYEQASLEAKSGNRIVAFSYLVA